VVFGGSETLEMQLEQKSARTIKDLRRRTGEPARMQGLESSLKRREQ